MTPRKFKQIHLKKITPLYPCRQHLCNIHPKTTNKVIIKSLLLLKNHITIIIKKQKKTNMTDRHKICINMSRKRVFFPTKLCAWRKVAAAYLLENRGKELTRSNEVHCFHKIWRKIYMKLDFLMRLRLKNLKAAWLKFWNQLEFTTTCHNFRRIIFWKPHLSDTPKLQKSLNSKFQIWNIYN